MDGHSIKFNNTNNNSIFVRTLKSYAIVDFLINGNAYANNRKSWILPPNIDKYFLKYKGTVNFTGLKDKDIGVFELSFGNTNWAFFMQFANSNSVALFTNIYEPLKGIKIIIRKNRFELEYLNFYGFPSESHYSFRKGQDIIKLKTVQANLEPFYKLWDLFKIIKENVPSVVGEIYNASFYRLNKNERVPQPIILQLLGKRVSYYTSARMSMQKQREPTNEMRNAVKIIETVKDLTVQEVMINYKTKCRKSKPLSMHLLQLLYDKSYENLKFADFFSQILKNKSIIITQSDVMNLYDLVRTAADLKPCTLNSIKSIQGTHIMVKPSTFRSPTTKYGKTKRKLNSTGNRSTPFEAKRRKSLMNYKNRNGMLNGKVGKINDVINKGSNYMVILKLKENNTTQVFMGNYDQVLHNIKAFINFDRLKYLQYYVNKNGIKNKLNVKIKDVFDLSQFGLVNNKNRFAATINTRGQDAKSIIKSETISGSFSDLKTQLDRMINNKIQRDIQKKNNNNMSNNNNNAEMSNKNNNVKYNSNNYYAYWN